MLAGAEPFTHDGTNDIGVLLCHGFTSTPQSMRPWGERLAAEGYSVRCPRLPGHGTDWRECNRTRWPDWYGCLSGALDELARGTSTVFVFGLSMGGTLALRLAEQRVDDVAGLVLVNPSVTTLRREAKLLGVLSKVLGSMPGIANDIAKPGEKELAYDRLPLRAAASLAELWRVVRADLGRVRAPVLLLRSAGDHVVEPVNARIVADGVASAQFTETVLANSFHVATLDYDAPAIFQLSVEFAGRVQRERAERPV